jgi:putative FmdB family regulatory protein
MPLYEYHCQGCGKEEEIYFTIEKYKDSIGCPVCGAKMDRKFSFNIQTYPIKNARASMNGKVLWEA